MTKPHFEQLFIPLHSPLQLDVDPNSVLTIDRCLHHVRERLSNPPTHSHQYTTADGTHSSIAAHIDDVNACRDLLWQYVYHPKSTSNKGVRPQELSSPHSRHNLIRNEVDGNKDPANVLAVLRKMETQEFEFQRRQLEDVARRSVGIGTEPVSGDAAESMIVENQTSLVPREEEEEEAVSQLPTKQISTTMEKSSSETVVHGPEEIAAGKRPSSEEHPHQRREDLLAFFDALRPDPLVGALPLPTSHFGNDPYKSKRSKNLLLLKYLGITYPGGKKALQRHLPFEPKESVSSGGEGQNTATAVASKRVAGRGLMLFEDQRRRSLLSAVPTQLGGGVSSQATFIQCLKSSSNNENRPFIRVGNGSSANPPPTFMEVAKRTIDHHGQLKNNKDHRSLTVRGTEYLLASLATSPFDQKHYPTKLFGFIQPTAIGSHSVFPLTRFNIFELEHLQTPSEKLKQNMQRAKWAQTRQQDNSDANGAESEELCLKKWSLFGTVFPATGAFHVKGIWSANAKLSPSEVLRAFRTPSLIDENSHTQQKLSLPPKAADPTRLTASDYRLGTGPKEKGLVSVGLDADRVRAIELLSNTNAGNSTERNAADTIQNADLQPSSTVEAVETTQKSKARGAETISRPLKQSDRKVLGLFHDTEVSVGWRRFWNPRWQVEGYVKNVITSSPSPSIQRSDDGQLLESVVAQPSATIAGVRVRSDHKGRFFVHKPHPLLAMWFATRKSVDAGHFPGWASSTWSSSAFLDPIQRHGSLKTTIDITNLSFLPSWPAGVGTKETETTSEVGSQSPPSMLSKAYARTREFLAFDLRLQMVAEAKHGGDVGALYYGDKQNTSALTTYLQSVRLPNPQSNTVRGVIGHPEAVYGTQRIGGRWFLTSTLELSKPFSISGATAGLPPLRFLVFWNGLWASNAANNKESIGYAIRREPHASRRELKGWYNEYLPTQLECSWSHLWSSQRRAYTSDPQQSDLPAGSTFFKFMKCGAVWDIQ